jgi:PHD/YefM family antitoxin component YafN of YafNO toxin-antitoxin module
MNKKTPAGVCMSLEEFNRIQRAAGLPERVAVKKSNKKNQNANRAARAQANRDMKSKRQGRGSK